MTGRAARRWMLAAALLAVSCQATAPVVQPGESRGGDLLQTTPTNHVSGMMNDPTDSGTYQRVPFPLLHHDDGDEFVVIAHRGASAAAPENTMAAFRKAVDVQAEMIELDVMLSRDGVPVLFHDADLDAKSNGQGPLGDLDIEQLRRLDVGSWFSEAFAGERMPTLEEVLAWAAGRISLNIEIKTEAWRESLDESVEPKVVELVRRHGMERHVIFSSFDYRVIRRLKTLAPDLPTAVLYEPSQSEGLDPVSLVRSLGADGFNCSWRELTPEWLASLKREGIPVLIYTVNDRERMDSLISQGVSGIFSDHPDLLREAAHEVKPR
jgi:glycerophosphoryl diester phosphodiesterase